MREARLGRRTGVARYHQIYTLLARALADGTIPAGNALPTERELMRRYQVSRNTVRHALARLEREKRIIRRRGSGTYARHVQSPLPLGTIAGVPDDLHVAAPEATARTLQFGKSHVPGYMRDRWPIIGSKVLLVQRLWSIHEQRIALCTLHIEEGIGRKLSRRSLGTRSVFTVLEAGGTVIGPILQTCRAVAADALVAEHLGIMPGSPLLVLSRWVHDGNNRPLLHQHLAYRAELYELRFQLTRNESTHALRPRPDPAGG